MLQLQAISHCDCGVQEAPSMFEAQRQREARLTDPTTDSGEK